MIVKQLHELSLASIERYINTKTDERFTINYNEGVHSVEFGESYAKYNRICYCSIIRVWPLVNHDGRAVLAIEYDDPA